MAEYIERESALYEAEKYACSKGCVSGRHSGIADIIADNILKIPAADVRPERHGYWIDNTMWYGHLGVILKKCSACGFEVQGDPTSRKNGMGGKYCENCGAKMDGKDGNCENSSDNI